MSAAGKLKALDTAAPPAPWSTPRWWTSGHARDAAEWEVALRNALPQIVAVVEAAESFSQQDQCYRRFAAALAALDDALGGEDK